MIKNNEKWVNAKGILETNVAFNTFMNKYGKKYSESVESYIRGHFYKDIGSYWLLMPLYQIYSELGIFPDDRNTYIAYFNKLIENFDIGKNILDVASGYLPAFANIVAERQIQLGSGTVTICDPTLIIDKVKHTNMVMTKEIFTRSTDLSKYDLITSIMPCETTETLIKTACENNKDFFIALCPCEPINQANYDDIPSFEKNTQLAKQLVKEYNMGELVVDYLDKSYSVNTPLIYNKR